MNVKLLVGELIAIAASLGIGMTLGEAAGYMFYCIAVIFVIHLLVATFSERRLGIMRSILAEGWELLTRLSDMVHAGPVEIEEWKSNWMTEYKEFEKRCDRVLGWLTHYERQEMKQTPCPTIYECEEMYVAGDIDSWDTRKKLASQMVYLEQYISKKS